MGARHYADHEIRYLTYSILYNSKVRGENEAMARQLKRSLGAVLQEKSRIRNVMKGKEQDGQIERVLAEFVQKRKRTRKMHPVMREQVKEVARLGLWGKLRRFFLS